MPEEFFKHCQISAVLIAITATFEFFLKKKISYFFYVFMFFFCMFIFSCAAVEPDHTCVCCYQVISRYNFNKFNGIPLEDVKADAQRNWELAETHFEIGVELIRSAEKIASILPQKSNVEQSRELLTSLLVSLASEGFKGKVYTAIAVQIVQYLQYQYGNYLDFNALLQEAERNFHQSDRYLYRFKEAVAYLKTKGIDFKPQRRISGLFCDWNISIES